MAPLRFVVVLNHERLIFSIGGHGALLRSHSGIGRAQQRNERENHDHWKKQPV